MTVSNREISLGGKTVRMAEPYVPDQGVFPDYIGREPEMRMVIASWMAINGTIPMNPLLIGEPGVGKNRMVYELAKVTGQDLYIFQGHEDVTAEDLACMVRFSDREAGMMDYILSPLVTAMFTGGICFLDEIGKIRPRALALLAGVLDERRSIDSNLLGERVQANPAFRFVAATNTTDINLLPEFIVSRMRPQITIGFPSKEEIDAIIRSQCRGVKKEIDRLIDHFWVLWSEHSGTAGSVAPRDVICLFGLASRLASYDAGPGAAKDETRLHNSKQKVPGAFFRIEPGHLEAAFQQLFTEKRAARG